MHATLNIRRTSTYAAVLHRKSCMWCVKRCGTADGGSNLKYASAVLVRRAFPPVDRTCSKQSSRELFEVYDT